jgi:tetratricopeptide (TPR) repeat protein
MKTHKIYLLSAILLTLISCDNYLDVKPKGKRIIKTIRDYDRLLYKGHHGSILSTADSDVLFLTADDWVSSTEMTEGIGTKSYGNIRPKLYKWDKDLFVQNPEQVSWNTSYKHIYVYNLVINEIKKAVSLGKYTEVDRKRIEAEGYVGRAYEYWLLVNTFAKQYSKTTAANDPGVPIITIANAKGETPKRSSVKEVYDFIIKDISAYLQYLPEKQISRFRVSKGTAYAYLARFYLQMGDYKKALTNASLAIAIKDEISDYTIDGDMQAYKIEEAYISKHFQSVGPSVAISDEVEALLDKKNDARFKHMLSGEEIGLYDHVTEDIIFPKSLYALESGVKAELSHAPSVPEMYLIRAECNARSGDIDAVATDINTLRKKRLFNYKAINFSNKKESLKFVLDERRRELFFMGLRLFDLKRLNLEAEFAKSVTHTLGKFDYTLKAGSNNLILPIPYEVISCNINMKRNPRDIIVKTKAKKPNKATKEAIEAKEKDEDDDDDYE